MMNPVIGLDISRGQSEGQAFLNKGNLTVKALLSSHIGRLEELFNMVQTFDFRSLLGTTYGS
ncbi:hypothetical protein UB51_26020 [Paenibacillus sp. IHBB 10380]|nr:hypothetical protein UB51_00015 [Paenibacillus sp. IHBB 10380]AJS61315.1 hypothetical protein UB51_26020 [Paenibacillus sp. IHBB 10380]